MRSADSGSPSKHAVVGQVSTVCPMRSITRFGSESESIVNSRTLIPGRPSGVSADVNSRSTAASHLHAITEVANPVSLFADSRAHF